MDILNLLVSTGVTGVIGMILWHFVTRWMQERDKGHEKNSKAIYTLTAEVTELKASLVNSAQEAMKPAMMELTKAVGEMRNGIEVMNRNVSSMETVVQVFKAQIEERNKNVDKRLDNKKEWLEEHDIKILDHERRIGKIETTCQLYHKKG